jgi:hypothetical protein
MICAARKKGYEGTLAAGRKRKTPNAMTPRPTTIVRL